MFLSNKFKNVKVSKENTFLLLKQAKDLEKKYGKDKIVNATIGSIYDENENFFVLDIVKNIYSKLNQNDLFSYASSISGSNEYKDSVKNFVFGKEIKKLKSNISVTATAGGTGAIYTALKLYTNKNETILLPNYMWEAYQTLAIGAELKFDTYNLFVDSISIKQSIDIYLHIDFSVVMSL